MQHLISRKKETYPISDFLYSYLKRYGRLSMEGVRYQDLRRYNNAIPLYNEAGEDTLWSTVLYHETEQREIHTQLCLTYAILKAQGDISIADQLYIDRIDVCVYGNTLPFRVRIVNRLNDNFDYFYVKKVDANRLYGLELAHILSPNRITYFIHKDTIIEEHIIGIPAEAYIREQMVMTRFDQVRLAKEFVKFNERCFVCLLGDMHSGNFVIDMTRDFEKWHFRMHPIDFDQQSHHWRKEVYLPQFFPQNAPFVNLMMELMAPENVLQYQKEERALIANRIRVSHGRLQKLMEVMCEDIISPEDHVYRLGEQLREHYRHSTFTDCHTMGELVYISLQMLLGTKKPATSPLSPNPAALFSS